MKTKHYAVPVSTIRRWKLTPEDLTIVKLSLMAWSSKHAELERRRRSLLNRMKGDFFAVLYAPAPAESASDPPPQKAAEAEEAVKRPV